MAINLIRFKPINKDYYLQVQGTPPGRLPPTTNAAIYYYRRIYQQMLVWLGNDIDVTKWGWIFCGTHKGHILKPQIIPSCCFTISSQINKMHSLGNCDKSTCSCRKNVLHCTIVCGQCKGLPDLMLVALQMRMKKCHKLGLCI